MQRVGMIGFMAILAGGSILFAMQETPEATPIEKEHKWLQQFVGEWDTESEIAVGPDQPPLKLKGIQSARSIGGLWIVSEIKGDTPIGTPMYAVLTLGFDPQKKKFVGTWIDSATAYLWIYEGSLDTAGKILTLDTQGPNPMSAGKTAKFREVIEFKSKDHKVFTSSMQSEDGQWQTFVTANFRRK